MPGQVEKVCYLYWPHPEFPTTEGSLKTQLSLIKYPSYHSTTTSHLPHMMTLNDAERPNLELEGPQATPAPNPLPDAEMTSADQPTPAVNESELCTKADCIPAGSDDTQMTQDQLALITESVWQRIGQCLEAKCSRDSTEREDTIEKLFKLQTT